MSSVKTILQVNKCESDKEMVNYYGTFSINGEFLDKEGVQMTLDQTFNIHILFKADNRNMLRVCLYKITGGSQEKAWTSIIGNMAEWKQQGSRSSRDMRLASSRHRAYSTVAWNVLNLFFKLYQASIAPPANKIREGRFEDSYYACDAWIIQIIYDEFKSQFKK